MNLASQTNTLKPYIPAMATTIFTKKSTVSDAPEPALNPPPTELQTAFVKKPRLGTARRKKREMPEGLWTKCPKCEAMLFTRNSTKTSRSA